MGFKSLGQLPIPEKPKGHVTSVDNVPSAPFHVNTEKQHLPKAFSSKGPNKWCGLTPEGRGELSCSAYPISSHTEFARPLCDTSCGPL